MSKNIRIVAKGSAFMFVGLIVKTALIFFKSIIIGWTFGADILGAFTISNLLFQLISIITVFGIPNAINKFLPQYNLSENTKKIQKLIGTSLRFVILTSLAFIIIIFLSKNSITNIFGSIEVGEMLVILILGIPFFSLIRILVSISTGLENASLQAIVENMSIPLFSIVLLYVFLKTGFGFYAIPLSLLLSYVGNFVIAIIMRNAMRSQTIRLLDSLKYFDPRYLRFSLPIFATNLILFIKDWFETFALGTYREKSEVGIFSVALLTAKLPLIFYLSLNTILFPTLSRINSEGRFDIVKNVYRISVRLLTFMVLPISFILTIYSNDLIRIFGKGFSIKPSVMAIIASGVFLNIFAGPINSVLTILNKNKLVFINSIIAVVIGAIMSFLFIPKYGIWGAAISNFSSIIIQNYLGILELKFTKKFLPYNMKSIFILISGSVIGFTIIILKNYLKIVSSDIISLILQLSIVSIFFYTTYALVITLFKLYENDDLSILKRLMRTKKDE